MFFFRAAFGVTAVVVVAVSLFRFIRTYNNFSLSPAAHNKMRNPIEDALMGRLKRGHFILRPG